MEYVYRTQGTCSTNIELNVEDGVVKEVAFCCIYFHIRQHWKQLYFSLFKLTIYHKQVFFVEMLLVVFCGISYLFHCFFVNGSYSKHNLYIKFKRVVNYRSNTTTL